MSSRPAKIETPGAIATRASRSMMMPKERLRRLPMSQPRVKWSVGASSWSRCSTAEVGMRTLVSWAAIAAGAIAAAALTLVLLAFGAGMGFSAVSPWGNSGVSVSTFQIGTGLYLIVVAMLASAIGGYIAGRLRTRWVGVHSHEVFFRDTAHGFLAWGFATVLSAAFLTAAASNIAGGASTASVSAIQSAGSGGPTDYYVDLLLRSNPTASPTTTDLGA